MVTFISKFDLEIFSPRLIHPSRRRVLTICRDVGVVFQPFRYLACRNYVRHPHTHVLHQHPTSKILKGYPSLENSPLFAIIRAMRFSSKKNFSTKNSNSIDFKGVEINLIHISYKRFKWIEFSFGATETTIEYFITNDHLPVRWKLSFFYLELPFEIVNRDVKVILRDIGSNGSQSHGNFSKRT